MWNGSNWTIASKLKKPLALITSRSIPASMLAPAWNEFEVIARYPPAKVTKPSHRARLGPLKSVLLKMWEDDLDRLAALAEGEAEAEAERSRKR